MKSILSHFCLKSLGLAVLLWSCGALVQLSQEKKDTEQKQGDPAKTPASQSAPEKKATEEYDEVRSPFGIQRVPRRAGGSPFQQPTVPVAPAAPATTPPPVAAQAPPPTAAQAPGQIQPGQPGTPAPPSP